MNNKRIGVSDILLVALSLCFLLGIRLVFHPCGPMEDGGWMTCHWAGQAVSGLAALLLVISVIHLAVRSPKAKQGLSMAVIPTAVLAGVTPGHLIGLCMMHDMRCQMIMRPATLVFAVLLAAVAVLDIVMHRT